MTSQGFTNIADMSEDGKEEYIMQDTIHLGWRGWLKLDTYVEDFLGQQGTKVSYKINDDFYSKDWGQKDPRDIEE